MPWRTRVASGLIPDYQRYPSSPSDPNMSRGMSEEADLGPREVARRCYWLVGRKSTLGSGKARRQ